jgi:hypothetical protein
MFTHQEHGLSSERHLGSDLDFLRCEELENNLNV